MWISCASKVPVDAEKAGMTSAVRLHDATNANPSTMHDVANQAANQMALKDVDKELFNQRISLTIVTTTDENNNINILERSGIWPGNVCAPRIIVKATFSFSTRT